MVTGTIFKGLTFDGVDSTQYGVYITGEAVYNAPMRDVEMIEIPGRNGAYALDKGRFTNIEVTYPAGIYGKDESEFAQAISDFRNALCSRKGYCRLTDGYNSNEYRMAVYSSGLEVSPALLKAGQFDITFNCKPQRFLTSGETQSNVTSGGTITNPTLFESHPLLFVDGYGDFDINGEEMTIEQGSILGETLVQTTRTITGTASTAGTVVTASDLPNVSISGDTITLGKWSLQFKTKHPNNRPITDFDASPVQGTYAEYTNYAMTSSGGITNGVIFYVNTLNNTFSYGTSATHTETVTVPFTMTFSNPQSVTVTKNVYFAFSIAYDGSTKFTLSCTLTTEVGGLSVDSTGTFHDKGMGDTYVDSTRSALGNLYIDLDIGECYRIENGQYISINTATILPADLPVLKPGANVITYDNSFTSFKITPRWWKV